MELARTFARGRTWWIESERPAGGYVLVREEAIHNAWRALEARQIQLRDLRTWLACFEVRARRSTVGGHRQPKYTPSELGQLISCPQDRLVRASARRLEAAGLALLRAHRLEIADGSREAGMGRLVPIPRRLLRLLCKPNGRAFIGTTLAHILRALFYRSGKVVSGGYCKISDVSERFGISERAARQSRESLIKSRVLITLAAEQTRLNRLGLPVVFSLSDAEAGTRSAPRTHPCGTPAAPPIRHKHPSLRKVKHQKPPTMRAVTVADLESPQRLDCLHKEAVGKGWARPGLPGQIEFFAFAERAKTCGRKNPPGLFAWLVRGKKAAHVTLADEDAARRACWRLNESVEVMHASKMPSESAPPWRGHPGVSAVRLSFQGVTEPNVHHVKTDRQFPRRGTSLETELNHPLARRSDCATERAMARWYGENGAG